MGLFRRKPDLDTELESRVDRLESECRQAKLHCESLPDGAEKQNRLKDVEVAEQAVAGHARRVTRPRGSAPR